MRMTKALAAALLAVSAAFTLPAGTASAQGTLKVVMHSDLKIVDPIWTTAYITRNHGYMIYDTLFAMDEKGEIKPQMVEKYDRERRQAHLHVHAARRPRSGTTARRSPPRTASPRSSAGAHATRRARS